MAGKLTLTYSADWHELTQTMLENLPQARGLEYPWLYICRTYSRVQYLKDEFQRIKKLSAGVFPPFFTRDLFINQFLGTVVRQGKFIAQGEARYLIYHILKCYQKDFAVLSPEGRPPTPALLNFLTHAVQALHGKVLSGNSKTREKLKTHPAAANREIFRLYEKYREWKARNLFDEEDFLQQLENRLRTTDLNALFPGVREIVWEWESGPSDLELRFIRRLTALGWDVSLLFHYEAHPDFFPHLESAIRRLEKETTSRLTVPARYPLLENFYRIDNDSFPYPANLRLWKFSDAFQEAHQIIKHIKKSIVDGAVSPDRVVVSTPNSRKYLPLIRSACKHYGVPYQVNLPLSLPEALPIQHLYLFVQVIRHPAPLPVLRKIMQSPFFAYHDMLQGVPVEEVLNSLRVGFDLNAMLMQGKRLLEFQKENEEAEPEETVPFSAYLEKVLTVLQQILELIHPLTGTFTPADLFRFFTDLVEKQGMVARILQWKEDLPPADVANYLQALRKFLDELEKLCFLSENVPENTVYRADQLDELFQMVVSGKFVSTLKPRGAGIAVVAIEEMDCTSGDHLYLLGMNEADFPRKELPGFIPLAGLEDILTLGNLIHRDRVHFLRLLQQPWQAVVISVPEWEGSSPVVPSGVVTELGRILKIQFQTPPELPVYSTSELLEKIAAAENHSAESLTVDPLPSLIEPEQMKRFAYQREVVRQRSSDAAAGIYDGNLAREPLLAEYLQTRFGNSTFSVSALELYARCPMLFFLQRILGVQEPEEFEDWLTPREKGELIHKILFRFYSEFPPASRNLAGLLKIGEEEISLLPFPRSILWEHQKEAFLGSEFRKGLFPAFWEYESAISAEKDTEPYLFEIGFGAFGTGRQPQNSLTANQPFYLEQNGQLLYLRGIADRVERSRDGGVMVVDYKTGSLPEIQAIKEGLSLQLPLYLLVLSQLLATSDPKAYPLGAAYYQLRNDDDQGIQKVLQFVHSPHWEGTLKPRISFPLPESGSHEIPREFSEFLAHTRDLAFRYFAGIRQGSFLHTPKKAHCQTGRDRQCAFAPVCRVNWSRIKKAEAN